MDCDHCQETLLDLAYGELGADAAKQSREHIRQCASCRAALEKLERGLSLARELPRVEVPHEVGARLLALAETKMAATGPVTLPTPKSSPGFFQPLIELMSRLATGPQVGMVTLTLLIAVVGLLALPQLRHESSQVAQVAPVSAPAVSSPAPVVNPTAEERPQAELAAKSAASDRGGGVQPAARLDLEVDKEAKRIRSKDELARLAQPARAARPTTASEATKTSAKGAFPAKLGAEPTANAFVEESYAAKPMEKRPAEKKAQAEAEMVASSAAHARERASAASTGAAQPAALDDLLEGALASGPRGAAAKRDLPMQQPAPEAHVPAAAPAPFPASQQQNMAQDQRAASGSKAKQVRRLDCASSSPRYERTVASAPGSAEAGAALIELALCARQRGDEAGARSLLERAARISAVSARARALLDQVPRSQGTPQAPAAMPAYAPPAPAQQAPAR